MEVRLGVAVLESVLAMSTVLAVLESAVLIGRTILVVRGVVGGLRVRPTSLATVRGPGVVSLVSDL